MIALVVLGAAALLVWAASRARPRIDISPGAPPTVEIDPGGPQDQVDLTEVVRGIRGRFVEPSGPSIRAVDTRGTVEVNQTAQVRRRPERTRVVRRRSSLRAPTRCCPERGSGVQSRLYTVTYDDGSILYYYARLPTGIPTGTRPSEALAMLGRGVPIWQQPSGRKVPISGGNPLNLVASFEAAEEGMYRAMGLL